MKRIKSPCANRHCHEAPQRVAKLLGADIELGNFIIGAESVGALASTGADASQALLMEVRGVERKIPSYGLVCNCAACQSRRQMVSGAVGNPLPAAGFQPASSGMAFCQDLGRKYLPTNSGCIYVDLNHLELAAPETLSAYDHVAAWRAMLRIAAGALERANRQQPEGRRIVVMINNSDGLGNAYGSHVNALVSRQCFDNIFSRKLHHQLVLASYLVSAMVFSGNGKVGSENGRPAVDFQISSRADFFETLCGPQTTYRRPIVNSRDEALVGHDSANARLDHPSRRLARLHMICFDNTLMQTATLLKVGVTQIILSMLEQGEADLNLVLDDPVSAAVAWSHDPGLRATARLAAGGSWTVLDMQEAFLERATRFVEAGRADGIVPRVGEIMALWSDTIACLRRRDDAVLARRLDWVLKRQLLQAVVQDRELDWQAAEIKHLDQMYASLSPEEGLFWAYERAGCVDRVVPDGLIERFVHQPPDDTRAWLRAHLLRGAAPGTVEDVNWDMIRFRFPRVPSNGWTLYDTLVLQMADPTAGTRRQCETRLRAAGSVEAFVRGSADAEAIADVAVVNGDAGLVSTFV